MAVAYDMVEVGIFLSHNHTFHFKINPHTMSYITKIRAAIIFAGYWIWGFGLGESIDERPPLLTSVMVRCFVF